MCEWFRQIQRAKTSSRSPVTASDNKSDKPHPSRLLKKKNIGPPCRDWHACRDRLAHECQPHVGGGGVR